MYYADKIDSLRAVFGTPDVELSTGSLRVGAARYPIVDDVIVVLQPEQYCRHVRLRLGDTPAGGAAPDAFAEDIQYTFGAEWREHGAILPEHSGEFARYFDLVDLDALSGTRVCDLGCGSGRWSFFLKDRCRELVLVDFSEAIFVARENLRGAGNCLFFNADLTRLPFADDFCDLLVCLGVLHHLPVPGLDAVRQIERFAPRLLVFLYYALDNRPPHFRALLALVTAARRVLHRVRLPLFRTAFSLAGAVFVYLPLVALGVLLRPLGWERHVPLYDFYHDKSVTRITQDVYDRFFTRIEQRVTRAQIEQLAGPRVNVTVSPALPYWHFLVERS